MHKLLGSLALLLVAPAAVGQCINVAGTSYGPGDDFVANAGVGIDMGFAFPIGGATYQFVHPSSNGFAYLSDGTPTLTTADWTPSVDDMQTNEPRIAVLWDDLNLVAANGGDLLVDTSVPNQCTITWQNVVPYFQTTVFTMQAVLFPSGIVHFNYDVGAVQTTDTIVGVSPGLGALPAPAPIDLTGVVPSTTDMAYELFAANTLDLANGGVQLIPTLPGYVPVFLPAAGSCASVETYGIGCVSAPDAVFEAFTALGAPDICGSGTAITFVRGASDYTILDTIPGTYVAPTAGTVISALDDAYGLVPLSTAMPIPGGTTTSLQVCTNGFIALSANTPAAGPDWSPTVAEFEAFTEPTICGPWYDWSPNNGGQLVYEEIAGIMYVTWDAVPAYGQLLTDTLQYQFDLASGDVTIVYDTMSFGGNSAWQMPLFGYTPGLAVDALAVDMSVALPIGVTALDVAISPLAITGNAPVLGANWNLTTTNIDVLSPISITFLGDGRTDPGLPLTVIGLDAPGCSVYINTILGDLTGVNVGGSSTVSLPIPANPALTGAALTAQSICLTLANGANLLTSNGVEGILGN